MPYRPYPLVIAAVACSLGSCGPSATTPATPTSTDITTLDEAELLSRLGQAYDNSYAEGDSDAEVAYGTLLLARKLDRVIELLEEQNRLLIERAESTPSVPKTAMRGKPFTRGR